MKKKIGVVCDNYKMIAYETVLKRNSYTDLTFATHSLGFTAITFFVEEKDFDFATMEVNEICTQLEQDFKARRN